MLVVLALVLTGWQHRARTSASAAASNASPPERVAAALAWPLQRFFAAAAGALESVGTGLGQYRRLADENRRLRERLDELAAQKLSLTDAYLQNQQLLKELGFIPRAGAPPLAARVVAINYGLSRKRITILAPAGRQLQVGDIVRTRAGLVGRITEVSGNRGQVFPLIDGEHAVAGIIQRTRDQGMVRVAAQPEYLPDNLKLDKLIGRATIREGDVVMTSGMGEVYPPRIPIGTVTAVRESGVGTLDMTAVIRPFVDFDHLSFVLVERHGQ